jgi:2-oxoglutarate ferredoxin oxidoreductase subunit delta
LKIFDKFRIIIVYTHSGDGDPFEASLIEEERDESVTRKITMQGETKKKKEEPRIDIFKAWCKSCGICVAFCPTGALAKDETGNPYVKDIGKCISCGWCEIRCPDFAITVGQKSKKKAEGKGEEAESEERSVAAGQ